MTTTATTTAEDREQSRRKANERRNTIADAFDVPKRPLPEKIRRDIPSIRFEPRGNGRARGKHLRNFNQAKTELRDLGVEYSSDQALSDALLEPVGISTREGIFTALAAGRRDQAFDV